jgi:hypothetical protein
MTHSTTTATNTFTTLEDNTMTNVFDTIDTDAFVRGMAYACYFTAYRSLQVLNLVLDAVQVLLFVTVSFLYILEGGHQLLVLWADHVVAKAQQHAAAEDETRLLAPAKDVLLLSPAPTEDEPAAPAPQEEVDPLDELWETVNRLDEYKITLAPAPEFNTWTCAQLRHLLKAMGVKAVSKARKAALVETTALIYTSLL